MIDKNFCLSSYMAYRYIYQENINFYEGMHHQLFSETEESKRILVTTSHDIDTEIKKQFDKLYQQYNHIGILLSGGMDSAILASYLHPGSHAYTFNSRETDVFQTDVKRAAYYCEKYKLHHHFIEISINDYEKYTPLVMKNKCAPVHSIEPQIYKAALQALQDGVEIIIVGESADLIFGGMDKLISKEWNYEDFVKRYTFLEPTLVLTQPEEKVKQLYEKYRLPNNKIDYLTFMDEVFAIESSGSYMNAFATANMPYYDPYAILKMKEKLNLDRVRNGEPKYLIRELYNLKYPELDIPNKIPMPRPVDMVFKQWKGPNRPEFRKNIEIDKLTGNQKWQLWCAELFLNMNENSL